MPTNVTAYEILVLWERQRPMVVPEESGETEMLSSPALWNVLYQRLTYIKGSRNELQVAEELLERMRALVSQEVG